MAVVLQTEAGLFGWHSYGSGVDAMNQRAPFFNDFVGQFPASTPVHLYGTCNRGERGGGLSGWKAEMGAIATILGYAGPISGYDISHIGHEGCYVEYVRGDRFSDIYYKRQRKMEEPTKSPVDPALQQRIVGRAKGPIGGRYTEVTLEPLYGSGKGVTGVGVKVTRGNKGRFHKASIGQIDPFTQH